MKTFVKILVFTVVISCMFILYLFAESPITVKVDGEEVSFTDAAPFADKNSRIQVPIREIAEALGCKVGWNGETQTATIKKDYTEANTLNVWRSYDEAYITLYEYSRELILTVGSNVKKLNLYNSLYGERSLYSGGLSEQEMDTLPVIKDNRTYLPVKYLAESFLYKVSWDAPTQTVNITSRNSMEGKYISDMVATWEDMCAIALYQTEYTRENREFIGIDSAKIVFKDGRTVDVKDSIIDATNELKNNLDIGIAAEDIVYAGKIEYDFSPEENRIFQLQIDFNIADKEGNMGRQNYNRTINISEGQGGYL